MTNNVRRQTDAERLARWVREHGQAVFGFLLATTGDRHLAEDLAQDVFCRAWEARERYDELGRERGYLLRIADRLVRDNRRRKREIAVDGETWRVLEPSDDAAEPDVNLARTENEQQLAKALQSLNEPQRRALLLRFYGDLDFREIAEALECPLNTALSHAHRGLAVLRKLMVKQET